MWLVAGAIATRPLGVLLNAGFARILGPAGFGTLGAAMLTAGLATGVGAAGLHIGIQRHVARRGERSQLRVALALNIALGLFAGGAVFVFSQPISDHMRLSDGSRGLFLLIACLTIIQIILAGQNAVIAGASAFSTLALQGVAFGVLSLAIAIPLALHRGVNGAVLGTCVASGVVLLWASTAVRHLTRTPTGQSEPMSSLLFSGVPVVMADIAGQIALWWLIVRLGAHGSAAEIGYFRAAQTLSGLILLVPGALNPAIFSRLAEASREPEQFREVTAQTTRTVWMMTLPLVAAVAIWRGPILVALFGPAFEVASGATGIMLWWALMLAIYGVLWHALIGHGKPVASGLGALACLLSTVTVSKLLPGSSANEVALSLFAIQALMTLALGSYMSIQFGLQYRRMAGLLGLSVVVAAVTLLVGARTSAESTVLGVLTVAACIGVQWKFIASRGERGDVLSAVNRTSIALRRGLAACR
jgi:O-antigen/teichoic acid export membrane protein